MKFDLQIFETGAIGTQRKIRRLLEKHGPLYYGDIVMKLDGDPHTILQALIGLKNKGVIRKGQPDGKYYLVLKA